MGARTVTSIAALAGAVLMFFLGGNIPLFASMLGLRSRSRMLLSSMAGGKAGAPAAAVVAGGTAPPARSTRKSRAAEATALLVSVLADDERALCVERYPVGLNVTPEQVEFLHDQRYFLVITLRNNEELLHHALYELLNVVARLGPRNCFVSVFENNSKDKTPQFLALFTDVLQLAGVAHHLVSTLTLQKEIAALQKQGARGGAAAAAAAAAAAPAAGGRGSRRLLQEEEGAGGGDGGDAASSSNGERERWGSGDVEDDAASPLSWEEEVVEAHALEQLGLARDGEGGAWWPPEAEEEGEGAEEDAKTGAESAGQGSAATAALLAEAARVGAAWRASMKALLRDGLRQGKVQDGSGVGEGEGHSGRGANASSPLFPSVGVQRVGRGRLLADAPPAAAESDASSDLAILTEGKWTGNRIEFLARVRNRSIRPMFSQRDQYDRLIIMNDAYFCAEDVLRLALHRDADVACGMDFDTTNNYGVGFYDTWVTKDIKGQPFKKNPPYVTSLDEGERLRFGKAFPVFCCWNGVLVANAAPFYEGVRFRRGVPGECPASECSLFCKDFWRKDARNFLVDPHVRVAYDLPTWRNLHKINGMDLTSRFATDPSHVEWPEDIPWAAKPPTHVHCCGLQGNGRDPDMACFQEETLLPR